MAGGDSSTRRGMPKRARLDRLVENGPETSCDCCNVDLTESSYATLDGCGHLLCFHCFGEAQAARSVHFKMTCPCNGCSSKSISWKIRSYSSGSTRNAQRQHQPPVSQGVLPPVDEGLKKTHPNIYYQHQTAAYRNKYAILTLAVPGNSDGSSARVLCTELRTDGKTAEEGPSTLEMIYHIGRSLGPCLLPPTVKGAKSKNTFACITSIEDLEKEDSSPLRRFIHGLANADSRLDNTSDAPYSQRERNMSYVASELIRTLKGGGTHHASKLKDYISDSLTVANVPDFLIQLFSKCGLGKSTNYMNLAQDKAVDEKIKSGWDPRARGYGALIGAYDNIGTRKVKSYVQFTVMAILFYSVWDLIKLKIYPDPRKKDNIEQAKSECVSWLEEDWDDLKKDYTFKIEKKDAALLAKEVTIPMIQFVLEAYKENVLPSYDQSRRVMDGEEVTFTTTVSHSVSGKRSMPPQPPPTDPEQETDLCQTPLDEADIGDIDNLDDEHRPTSSNSMYARNNATVDTPIKEDLNAQKTVMGIVNYFCKIKDRCLEYTTRPDGDGGVVHAARKDGEESDEDDTNGNPWAQAGWDPEDWPRPWMEGRGVYLCGDGQPTFAMRRLKKTHDQFKDKVFMPFNGGFHTMLETHKLRGKMFGSAHLREVWGHWRSTTAQLDWVMRPGDPNQVEDELVMYYYGAIAAAIKELIDRRKEKDEDTDISAFDVFSFMQEEAQKSPVAQSVYNEIRFAEVIFLLQLAEEKQNAEMFVTGLKFASLLYTTAHATKYTEIAADFIVWWRCASEADKVIFENIIMTRKTQREKSIYTDRFVEWMVRDFRDGIGKHYRRGTDAAIIRRAHLMELHKEFQRALKKSNDDNDPAQSSRKRVAESFCYTFVYLIQQKLWNTDEAVTTPMMRRSIKPELSNISVDMIDLPVTGERRMDDFIHINNVEDEPQDKEKRISACLKVIQPTSEAQTDNDKRDLDRCISTTDTYVMDSYSKNELVAVYDTIKETLGDNAPKVNGKKNKIDYATAICTARKKFIEQDAQWEIEERRRVQEEIDRRDADQVASIERRMDAIKKHLFFYLLPDDHVFRSEVQYTKKIDVSVPTVDQNSSNTPEDMSWIQNISS